jgi:quercetin dioxygenase-like cupin family protein
MATIQFMHERDATYVRVKDLVSGTDGVDRGNSPVPEEEQLGLETRYYFPGDDETPQLFEVRCEPGTAVQPHSHVTDEIVYVLEGDIVFGARNYPSGSAVLVPRDTLYSFRAGPNGLRFLNFRGSADFTYLDRHDHAVRHAPEPRSPA